MRRFDIGLVPLKDNKFNECKSELKGLEYSILGIPYLASPLPAYRRLVKDGENGILCGRPREWYSSLSKLIEDELLRNMRRERTISMPWHWDSLQFEYSYYLLESLLLEFRPSEDFMLFNPDCEDFDYHIDVVEALIHGQLSDKEKRIVIGLLEGCKRYNICEELRISHDKYEQMYINAILKLMKHLNKHFRRGDYKMEKYLTIKEMAEILSVSEEVLERMIREGALPHLRIGKAIRLDRNEVIKKLKQCH